MVEEELEAFLEVVVAEVLKGGASLLAARSGVLEAGHVDENYRGAGMTWRCNCSVKQ